MGYTLHAFSLENAAKTACINGHPFDVKNTYRRKTGRQCKACVHAAKIRWRRRHGMRVKPVINGYFTVHKRMLKIQRGPCVDCGGPSTQWSLRPGTPPELLVCDPSGLRFSYNIDDYEPRCVWCHLKADGIVERFRLCNPNLNKTHCVHGHPFDASNTITTPRQRKCRACKNAASSRRYYRQKGQ